MAGLSSDGFLPSLSRSMCPLVREGQRRSGTEKNRSCFSPNWKGEAKSWASLRIQVGGEHGALKSLERCQDYKTGLWLGAGGQRRTLRAGRVRGAFSEETMVKLGRE